MCNVRRLHVLAGTAAGSMLSVVAKAPVQQASPLLWQASSISPGLQAERSGFAFQAIVLRHTLHKLPVMTVSFSNPTALKCVVKCTLVFVQHPAVLLPLQCCL